MREFLQRFGTLLAALLSGTIVSVPILPLGLGVPEIILWPITFGIGALAAALGAVWIGNRFTPPIDARRRLLQIVAISEATAAIVVVLLLSVPLLIPTNNLSLLVLGMSFIALSTSWATWHFGESAGSRLGRGTMMEAGLLVLVLLMSVPLLSRATWGACDREEKTVLAEFPQYEEDIRSGPASTAVMPEERKAGPPPEGSGCEVIYHTQDSQEQVHEYFSEQLASYGWTVMESPPTRPHPLPVLIMAYRDDYWYEVYAGPSEDGTVVVAIVRKSSETS